MCTRLRLRAHTSTWQGWRWPVSSKLCLHAQSAISSSGGHEGAAILRAPLISSDCASISNPDWCGECGFGRCDRTCQFRRCGFERWCEFSRCGFASWPEWCRWGLQRRCVFSRCSFDRRRRHRLIVIRRNLMQQQLRHAAFCDARKRQCKVAPLGSPMQMCHWAWTQYVSNLPELALQPSQLAGVALSRQRSYERAVHPCKDVGYAAQLEGG